MIQAITSAPIESFAFGKAASSATGSMPVGNEKIDQVARDFESLFASQMLKEMRKTLDPETMFGSNSGDVYGGMFDQFVGRQMAEGRGFGLAKMLRETLHHEQLSVRRPTGNVAVTTPVDESNVAFTAPRDEPNRQTVVGEAYSTSRRAMTAALTAMMNGRE